MVPSRDQNGLLQECAARAGGSRTNRQLGEFGLLPDTASLTGLEGVVRDPGVLQERRCERRGESSPPRKLSPAEAWTSIAPSVERAPAPCLIDVGRIIASMVATYDHEG
jgi:hypothetical protein